MKAAAHRMYRKETNKEKRQTALVMMASMLECTTLQQAAEMYRSIHCILCTETQTGVVMTVKEALLQGRNYEHTASQFGELTDVDMEEATAETSFNLRRNSPFAVFFRRAISGNQDSAAVSDTADGSECNVLFCRRASISFQISWHTFRCGAAFSTHRC